MSFIRAQWRVLAGALILSILIAGGVFYYLKTRVPQFPVAAGDTIASWSFMGDDGSSASSIAASRSDITHLTSLLGKGQYDDYDLNIGIALDYQNMGDGKDAYNYFNRAIKLAPATGKAYVDLAYLMIQLKAYSTAADAYAKAVAVEPGQLEYHLQRLTYLTEQFPTNTALVQSAFDDANKVFGDEAEVLAIEAQWLTGLKQYAQAIALWQRARFISPPSHDAAIDLEIARLKAKE